ncbi:MAG TPA: class I SAM-dependent methyltransferase [Pirellula sp.]|nr:class I SAM-dependent methyltransferase [Pirellula sp.]
MSTDLNTANDTPLSGIDDTHAVFNEQLSTYRRIVGENLMYHREVYDLLNKLLSEQMRKPFTFLDIACGDASASAPALKDTCIEHYYGIDLSARSLDLASVNLKVLPCVFDLQCCDFSNAMANWSVPVDVVWIGMSLHHFHPLEKVQLMKNVHKVLASGGLFLIWEPTLLDGETRAQWLDRFAGLRKAFAAITETEFQAMENHMRSADFPESADTWLAMGRQAGFGHAEEIFVMPNRMGRVFKYWN